MGKTAACIRIIQILSCRNIVTKSELADMLETNPRNIPEYIKEIEEIGYRVKTTRGIYGGYELDKSDVLPAIKLTPEEKRVINSGVRFLEKSQDFLELEDYSRAMGKVMGSFDNQTSEMPITMIDRFPLAMDKDLLQQRYVTLSSAIESQYKCEIEYQPAKGSVKKHIIHPYKLFVYNSSWFVVAWNETINEFGYFKLNRITSITATRNHFSVMKTYSDSEYVDSFGMKQNGEFIHVELLFKNLYTAISERVYGKNQVVEKLDDTWTSLKCDMQNKDMIKSFVLSWGAKCKVVEPSWLKDEIKAELDETRSIYD